MDETTKPFIGTGWKFPVEFSLNNAAPLMVSGADSITTSLTALFSTIMGERIMHPDYGSELDNFVFEHVNKSTITYMQAVISNAILFNEPRIVLNNVEIKQLAANPACLEIVVNYTITATNNRYNFVYPFYLNEATNLLR